MIKSRGQNGSKIMFVGDFPSKDDIKDGFALSGSSGNLVNTLLRQAGKLRLDEYYRTLYIKEPMIGYYAKNKKKAREIYAEALSKHPYEDILRSEVEEIKPNVIVPLGEFALNVLTGEKSIHNFRGSILPLNPTWNMSFAPRVIPVLHPRDIFQNWEAFHYSVVDYQKIVKYKDRKDPIKEDALLWIARNANELNNYFLRNKNPEFATFDIETRFNFISCIGFCMDGKEAVCAPLLSKDTSMLDLYHSWQCIYDFMRSNIPKVNQNIKFDILKLEEFGCQINNVVGDTMLAAHTVYAELPKSLAFLTSIYTEGSYYKDEGKSIEGQVYNWDRLFYYCAKDALYTWQIWKGQQEDLKDKKVYEFFFKDVMPYFHTYKKIDELGILVDHGKRNSLRIKYESMLKMHEDSIDAYAGIALNTNSPKQVGIFVYEVMKCRKHTHINDSGEQVYSTDEDTLTEIYLNEESNSLKITCLKEIILCKKISKVLDYLGVKNSEDGRMRTSFKLHGTDNGRTSAGKCIERIYFLNEKGRLEFYNTGLSFQTIPKHGFEFEGEKFGADIREIFIPDEGTVIIEPDLSNAEGRCVCVFADDFETLKLCDEKPGLHKVTAGWIFDLDPFTIDKKDKEYTLGKMTRHAGNLGMGADTLAIQVHVSKIEAAKCLTKFHNVSPKVKLVFHTEVERVARDVGYLISPWGRRRDFYGDKHSLDFARAAYSYLPQATISDLTKKIMLDLDTLPYAKLFSESHDSCSSFVKRERKDEWIDQYKKFANKEIDFSKCSLPRDFKTVIPHEISIYEDDWCNEKKV